PLGRSWAVCVKCKTRKRNATYPRRQWPDPTPPNGPPNSEKSQFFSGNSTPSANSNWLAEGVSDTKCLTAALLRPSANFLAWRDGGAEAGTTAARRSTVG